MVIIELRCDIFDKFLLFLLVNVKVLVIGKGFEIFVDFIIR